MTRKKVKLVWIGNDAARKASLKKRRSGLVKKVSELTTLCGVDAFVIIYSPGEAEPMLWPSRSEVEEMLERYQSISEMEKNKKRMNQETYLKERISKTQDNVMKDSKKNRDTEMSYIMHKLHLQGNDINCLELAERRCLIWLLEERMRDLRKRYDYFQQAPPLVAPGDFIPPGQEQLELPPTSSPQPPLLNPPPNFGERVQGRGGEFRANPTDSMMWDQWFLDMVKNSDNVAGGSGSGAPPPPPQGFNFGGFGSGEDEVGALGLGLPSGGANPFELGMAPPNPNPFGIGFPQGGFEGFPSDMNPLGLGPSPPLPTADVGGSDGTEEGFSGFFPSASDVAGLPWPPNISP